MAKSYCTLLYHIVYSTKDRLPMMTIDLRPRLHEYIGGAIRAEQGIPILVNGVEDHIHIFCKLRQDKAVSDVIRAIKANSSGWVHREFPQHATFQWQAGYGAFTVSKSNEVEVTTYVRNQEEHHRRFDYKAEFVALLKSHGMEYDPRYLWD